MLIDPTFSILYVGDSGNANVRRVVIATGVVSTLAGSSTAGNVDGTGGAAQFNGLAPGAFLFYLGTDPKKLDAVTLEMRSEIADLAKSGLTAEELERARAKMIGAEVIRNQSNSALAGVVAADELMGLGIRIQVVGDALNVGYIEGAMHTAHEVAREL